jgi:hypothetical protein
MTIAEAIKHVFRFKNGNITAQFDYHIDQTLVLRGSMLIRILGQLGCYWEGDRCILMDGSYIDFDLSFDCGVE